MPARSDRAEPHADEVQSLRPAAEQPRGLCRGGIGREVHVDAGREPARHQVADRSAHEVQLVAGGLEAVAELLREGIDLDRGHEANLTVGAQPHCRGTARG